MRIALVANSAWYIYNFRMSLIQELHKAGWEITVLTPVDDYINFLVDNDYIEFVPIKNMSRKRINLLQEHRLYRELKDHYRMIQPDVVLHYTIKANIYGSLAAKRLGIASVVVIPGLGYTFTSSSKLRGLIKRVYRYVLPYNKAVIFENHSDKAYFVKEQIITLEKGVVFKGCGVDTDYFAPLPKKREDTKMVFLFMGRLIVEKGIEDYIKAAHLVHEQQAETEFWVIGHIDADNPSAIPNATFLEWIRPPYIKYLGFKDDVREVIRDVECVVLPSYYPEGIPRVLQEGMSMERPIITADSDGCREAVNEGVNGYTVRPRDPDHLAETMLKIVDLSPEDRATMGKAGRYKAVREFHEDITLQQYLHIIHDAVDSMSTSSSVTTETTTPKVR